MNPIHGRVARIALLFALVSLLGLRAQAQTYVFGTASYSAPGINSTSPLAPIVTTDLNGDGIPDVAILGPASSGWVLSIFLGRADGSFGPRVDYSVQAITGQASFTVGDFNGDGKVDVIIINSAGASIFVGNGDGTLQPPVPLNQSISSGYSAGPSSDFNGDGKLDLLLVAPGTPGAIAILPGNGDGTFQSPVTYSVPIASYIVLGDFNGDGKPDIAVSGGASGSGEVSILINNGNGTFKSPVNYSISGNVQALATADLNGDGKLDLVVSSGGTSATISVLLGNGDGTFGSPNVYTSNLLSVYSATITVADFNGDGKPDLAVTNSEGPANAVAIVLGNGDGTFQNPPLLYSAGLLPAGVVSLDVNGDGKPDLAVAGGYGVLSYFSLTTLINRGDGTFPNSITYPVLQFPYSAVVGDFNGDGHLDIATTSFTQTGGVSVLLGKGDGTFQAHLDSPTGQSPTAVAVGDFNGDGKLDLVVAASTPTSGLLSTLIGNGDGTFQNKISQTVSASPGSLVVGDFNGDGKLDVAGINTPNAVSIFLGNGDGTFAAPVQYPTGPMMLSPYNNVLVGDFNGDGKLDLAVATDNGIVVLLGNGDGTFQSFRLVPSLSSSSPGDELLALADVNGDGKLDIVKAAQTGASIINVALGNGDGTFQQAAGFQIPSILNTQSTVVGDFNGDGNLDVAFASQGSDVVTIRFGNGDGTFKGHIEYSVPSVSNNVHFMLAADFNGDGGLDMAVPDFGNAEVSVFLNRAVAAFGPRELTFANQAIGTTSPEQRVTLTNAGAAPLAITSIATSGDFAETNDCGSSLSIGKACTANVTFAPTAAGLHTGTLSFTNNGSGVPQALVLSGTGSAGFLISFGPGSSASQTVTAGQTATYTLIVTPEGGFNGTVALACSGAPTGTNCTTAPASFSLSGTSAVTSTISVATTAVAFVPPVPQSTPALPVSLQLLNLSWLELFLVTFLTLSLLGILAGRVTRPARLALGAATMLVLIWAGCGGGGGSVSTEPPPAPLAAISPNSLSFSSQNQGTTSPAQSVTLTNSGNAALGITAISVGGTNPTDFQQTNSCGSSVAAGGHCTIGVSFMPTASGSRSATLSISDDATSGPQSVSLAGTGVPPVTLAGTYMITLTATSGSLTQTMHLTLTVQ